MSDQALVRTQQKALELNLDESIFGSFAEIGAGQEVARWFFRVGAASGTVAKTICAYDKAVSDELYGGGTRYVSRQRLDAMLNTEWGALPREVGPERQRSSRLFSFANTASARNYAGTNLCHAWVGIRFSPEPGAEPNDVLVHVNLHDTTNDAQQEALGIFGVNLVHAVFHSRHDGAEFLTAVREGLGPERIGIDVLDPQGPIFKGWNSTLLQASLAYQGASAGAVLLSQPETSTLAEVLYKRSVVVVPGHFDAVDSLHGRALKAACDTLAIDRPADEHKPYPLFAIPVAGGPPIEGAPARVDALRKLGGNVAIFEKPELFRMAAVIRSFTTEAIRFAVSIAVLIRVLEESQYEGLDGRLLEAIARLFQQDVRVYAFPARLDSLDPAVGALVRERAGEWVTAANLRPSGSAAHLYDYLLAGGFIVPLPSLPEPAR